MELKTQMGKMIEDLTSEGEWELLGEVEVVDRGCVMFSVKASDGTEMVVVASREVE